MLEEMDDHYVVFGTGNAGSRFSGAGFTLHLYCADPSGKLKDCMAKAVSTILFSATFLPIQYYKGLLGGGPEDFEMYARSSFSPARRKVVIVNDVTSRYRNRNAGNYERIARSIAGTVFCRTGNYMAFFPSYVFMESVYEAFCRICGSEKTALFPDGDRRLAEYSPPGNDTQSGDGRRIRVIAQKRRMEEAEKTAFLQAFEEVLPDRYLVGFCVMGGMFGEGIDLRDDRLIGTFVVGTGIPPVDSRREFLRDYFSKKGRDGYDFAYRFPGMNKVLQAAGRVIRTETDRGIVLLMDERFEERANRELFPVEWGCPPAMDSESAAKDVRLFWKEQPGTESL
jgi:Rad3-related DNA helicase